METKPYAGKVWAVYKNEMNPRFRWGTSGTVIAMFDSSHGAEKFIEARKSRDEFRGELGAYSVVPWLVQRGD